MTDRERVMQWAQEGVPTKVIAARLGVSADYARRLRRQLGCSIDRPWTQAETDRAEKLLDDGCSLTEVARTIGRSPATICRRFPGRGWTAQECGRFSRLVTS